MKASHTMSKALSAKPFSPQAVTDELLAKLAGNGYILPPTWPYPALATLDFVADANGWKHKVTDDGTTYTAPDGTAMTRSAHGRTPALVALSTKQSPFPLVMLPGSPAPAWLPKAGARRTKSGGPSTPRVDYAAMTDAELLAWCEPRLAYLSARVWQIEHKQGVTGFGERVRGLMGEPKPKGKGKAVKAKVAAKLPSARAKRGKQVAAAEKMNSAKAAKRAKAARKAA